MANHNGKAVAYALVKITVGAVLTVMVATQAWAMTQIVQNGKDIAANVQPAWLVKQLDRIEATINAHIATHASEDDKRP